MPNIDLIIFDMDGLMIDTETIAYRVWTEVLKQFNYKLDFKFYKSLIGSNLERAKFLCAEHFGNDFPFDEIKTIREVMTNEIISQEGLKLKPGLRELLELLNTLPIKKAVATSTRRERTMFLLGNTKLLNNFDYILCGDETTKSKPDPEIFLTVTSKLNCKPQNTIVLEDSLTGINAAYNGGMIPIMIPDMIKPNSDILKQTFLVFPTLLEFKQYIDNIYNQVFTMDKLT